MPRLRLLALLAAGLAVRLWGLPLWGTFDTEVQKAWSARAATAGLADIYGPSDAAALAREPGTPFPRTRFLWGTASYFVDYPPGSILVLWAAGKGYALYDPELPNRWRFNLAINVAPLLASLAILWLLRRSASGEEGWRRALVFWLNPAVVLAVPILGYQDTIFGALGLGAVLCLIDRRYVAATALAVAAGLVKPQGALLLPTLLAVVLREARPAAWLRAAGAGALVATLTLFPWWSRGHLLSALDGCLRPLGQTTLAPLGLNLWWIAGWAQEWTKTGPWPLARIVSIGAFQAWAGWDPRLVARGLLAASTAAIVWLLLRGPSDDRRFIPLSVLLQVHAYALFGTSVHENHSFLAVILAPLLLGVWQRARSVLWLTSGFLFASLFLAAGLGRRITRLATIEALRAGTLVDLSVLVALAHVVLVAALFLWVVREARGKIRPA